MDTAALHCPRCSRRVEQPLAWGAAENRIDAAESPAIYGGSYRDNPQTSAIAARALAARNGYARAPGLP